MTVHCCKEVINCGLPTATSNGRRLILASCEVFFGYVSAMDGTLHRWVTYVQDGVRLAVNEGRHKGCGQRGREAA